MKALTLTQPWATLVAIGAKRYETRSWYTAYRGPLAIHASKGFPKWAQELVIEEPFYTALDGVALPTGVVLATARLFCCLPTVNLVGKLSERERDFGDFEIGRFAWQFGDIQLLPEPVPAKGALGLWEWNDRRGHG